MNLFCFSRASYLLVPKYGTGDSVVYSIKSEDCTTKELCQVYADMVRDPMIV
jgi:hypothetical protein